MEKEREAMEKEGVIKKERWAMEMEKAAMEVRILQAKLGSKT